MMEKPEKRTAEQEVAIQYDSIVNEYATYRSSIDTGEILNRFIDALPSPKQGVPLKVLDVGCGTGIPVLKHLAERGYSVTGLDLSDRMLEAARSNVSDAILIKQNMTELNLPQASFDGLVCLHAIIHVPREKHPLVLRRFHDVLRPEGVMLLCTGSEPYEATHEFLGKKFFFSYESPKKSLDLVEQAGFEVVYDQLLTIGGEEFYWILANTGEKHEDS